LQVSSGGPGVKKTIVFFLLVNDLGDAGKISVIEYFVIVIGVIAKGFDDYKPYFSSLAPCYVIGTFRD
jgi:hypothetical protein